MPKIVDKKQMRQNILQAALQTFVKYGFHNSTMAKIAKEAGVAKGTLYLYFESKEALSIAFVQGYFSKLEALISQQGMAYSLDSFINQLQKTLLVNREQASFIPVFFETFGPSFKDKAFRDTIAYSFDKIGIFYTQNIIELIKKGELNEDINPHALGRVLISMLDGILLHYGLFSPSQSEYEKMVEESLALLKRGLV